MIAITYRITLQQPLLATSLNGDPNSGVTYPYIPGSMIRGMLIGQIVSDYQDFSVEARHLFFDGQVRYLNAYPALGQFDQRMLPIPLSLRREKAPVTKDDRLDDFAVMMPDSTRFNTPVSPEGQFIWLEDGDEEAVTYSPSTQISIHTLRNRFAGCPERDLGAVYRYEALAEGEEFIGAVVCANKTLADEVKKIIPSVARLGGVQTAGYGRVKISDIEIESEDEWQEIEIEEKAVGIGEEVVITLLSDAILRNGHGATHTDLVAELNLPLELVRAFMTVTPVGGFNRKWGLPLPQVMAIKAGSAFTCRATSKIPTEEINEKIGQGIGERCSEGFGRLVFGWQQSAHMKQRQYRPDKKRVRPVDLNNASLEVKKLAKRMSTRRRRHDLNQALSVRIKDLSGMLSRNQPSNSQLGRVRVIVRNASQDVNLDRVSRLFKREIELENGKVDKNPRAIKERALRKFEMARVDGIRLSDWIVALADNPIDVWDQFEIGDAASALGKIDPEDGLEQEYTVRLIDGVLNQAMQQNRNPNRGGNNGGTS